MLFVKGYVVVTEQFYYFLSNKYSEPKGGILIGKETFVAVCYG